MRPYTRVISSDITKEITVDQVDQQTLSPEIIQALDKVKNKPTNAWPDTIFVTNEQLYKLMPIETPNGIKHVSPDEFCRIVKGEADAFIRSASQRLSSIDDNDSQLQEQTAFENYKKRIKAQFDSMNKAISKQDSGTDKRATHTTEFMSDPLRGIVTKTVHYNDGSSETFDYPKYPIIMPDNINY